MSEKFYVDNTGIYKGSHDGDDATNPYLEEIEVPTAPTHAGDKWNGLSWDDYVLTIEEQLSTTEDIQALFQKVEELIEYVETNKPLSQETKNWVNNRKTIKGE